MVYDTQNHQVSGLRPSSGLIMLENTAFRRLNLFPSSGGGTETPTLLGPLELISITGQTVSYDIRFVSGAYDGYVNDTDCSVTEVSSL
jgi:hypothetical protein